MKNKKNMENGESKFKKMLFNEISLMVAVGSVIIGIVLFITGTDYRAEKDIALINQDIDTIKTNHLVHIEEAISNINDKNNSQDETLNTIQLDIREILTRLK